MQEEVENRTLTLVVSGTKFTGRMFKAAISKYMAHRKEKKLQKQRSRDAPVIPHGKQTVKQLVGQNQGISNIEITDPSIKEFEKIARKYGVDYAVKKDRSSSPPKYLIFFKGRDADALTAPLQSTPIKKSKRQRKQSARLYWQNLTSSKRWLKMLWWIAPSERSWNDEKDIGHQKARFAEYAVYPAGAVCYQFWRGMANGTRGGCFRKVSFAGCGSAWDAAKFLAQPAPVGSAGGAVLCAVLV